MNSTGTASLVRTAVWRFAAICMALAVAGCSAQFVSSYDAETEKQITAIQKQVESLMARVERGVGTEAAAYEHYADAYRRLNVDARLLSTRAQAIDQNSITAEQTEILIGWLGNLEQLHETGIDSVDVIGILRSQAQQIFVAMLRFELAKKRDYESVGSTGGG